MLNCPQWLQPDMRSCHSPAALRELTKKSYLNLLENEVQVDVQAVAEFHQAMDKEKRSEEKRLQAVEKEMKKRLDEAHARLKAMNRSGASTE